MRLRRNAGMLGAALLCLMGFGISWLADEMPGWLGVVDGGRLVQAFHHGGGILGWLALAGLSGRIVDYLL
ncbi:MAG: hypothetical protein K2Q10_05075, partial [Rhodospirillales bacterium]|nr:hypothetical protein [Rhodospirillales bacterium]